MSFVIFQTLHTGSLGTPTAFPPLSRSLTGVLVRLVEAPLGCQGDWGSRGRPGGAFRCRRRGSSNYALCRTLLMHGGCWSSGSGCCCLGGGGTAGIRRRLRLRPPLLLVLLVLLPLALLWSLRHVGCCLMLHTPPLFLLTRSLSRRETDTHTHTHTSQLSKFPASRWRSVASNRLTRNRPNIVVNSTAVVSQLLCWCVWVPLSLSLARVSRPVKKKKYLGGRYSSRTLIGWWTRKCSTMPRLCWLRSRESVPTGASSFHDVGI